MIRASSLTKHYGARLAVDDVSLEVDRGEILGFLGPNGAGKTTTILMLMGILKPDAGWAEVAGRRVARGDLRGRRLIGAVSEHPHLYDDMTVGGYLAFFGRLFGVDAVQPRSAALLEELGLADRRDDRAVDLSKGLQQKLSLSRALLHDPPVLILDEPASGLDPHGIREFREILLRERERGRAILISSHVLSEVERIADRVVILSDGRVIASDATAAIAAKLSDVLQVEIELDGSADEVLERARSVEGVRSASAAGERLTVTIDSGPETRRRLARELAAGGAVVLQMRDHLPSLEEAFVTLTAERVASLAPTADVAGGPG